MKRIAVLVAASALAITGLVLGTYWGSESTRYRLEPLVHRLEATLTNTHYAPLSKQHAGRWITRNDFGKYMHQRRAAADHGVPLIEDQRMHDELVADGTLVRLPVRGDGYRINTSALQNSSPYFCAPMVAAFTRLTSEWAARMREAGFNSPRVLVNSGTRTVPQQKRILEKHKGATKGISAHSYGAAIDLKRIEYRGRHGLAARDEARAILKDCLLQSEAFFWVPEGSNFHITAKPSGGGPPSTSDVNMDRGPHG